MTMANLVRGTLARSAPSAYSCLTVLADGTIGVLYEAGEKNSAETLIYANVSLDWIKNTHRREQTRPTASFALFGDHMVLQREQLFLSRELPHRIKMWVFFGDVEKQTTADTRGHWSLMLPPLSASKEPATCGRKRQ